MLRWKSFSKIANGILPHPAPPVDSQNFPVNIVFYY
jgi:hypothetical protein